MALPLTALGPTVRVDVAGGHQAVALDSSPQVLATNLSGNTVFLRLDSGTASETDIPLPDGVVCVFSRRHTACAVWSSAPGGPLYLTPVEGV